MNLQLQKEIEAARDLCSESDVEVRRIKQALAIAESVSAGRHGALGKLLELARKENSEQAPHLKAGEHFAYPEGRAAVL